MMLLRMVFLIMALTVNCHGGELVDYGDYRFDAPVDPVIFKQPHTLILVVDGQSMWGNFSAVNHYQPSGNVYELSIWDGKIYPSNGEAVMNCNGWAGRSSILPYLADMLINQGKAERVLICALNIGGTSAAQWSANGEMHPRKVELMRILNSMELTPNYAVSIQGQQDVYLGTSREAYVQQRVSGINAWRALGMNAPIVVGLGVHWTNVSNANPNQAAAIRAGQFEAAVAAGVAAGPDDDEWGDGYRSEGVHWNDLGRYYTVQRWLGAFPSF